MATANPTAKSVKSKTDLAIEYMTKHNVTAYAAALALDLHPSTVTKRLKLLAATEGQRCPCCHQIIKTGAA